MPSTAMITGVPHAERRADLRRQARHAAGAVLPMSPPAPWLLTEPAGEDDE